MKDRRAALLRGINVGRAKRVAMADLRAAVEGLGYQDVRTLLNSGNVVFTVPGKAKGDPGPRIEEAIATGLGVSSRVTVITAAELAAAIDDNPLHEATAEPSRFLVAFLNNPADRTRLASIAQQDWAPEAFAIGTRVAYLWCPAGQLESPLGEAVNRELRDAATTRNWATVIKLQALIEDQA